MNNRIKSLRLEMELSQRALAEKIGCSQKSVDGWEKNKIEPAAGFVCALADVFECTTDYLLGREDDFGNIAPAVDFTAQERALVQHYRALSVEKQTQLLDFAVFLDKGERHT